MNDVEKTASIAFWLFVACILCIIVGAGHWIAAVCLVGLPVVVIVIFCLWTGFTDWMDARRFDRNWRKRMPK